MSDVFDPNDYGVADGGAVETTYAESTADGTFTSDDGYAVATAAESEQWDAWQAETDLSLAKSDALYEGDTDSYYALADAESEAHAYGQEAYAAETGATYSDYDSSSYDSSSYDSSSYDSSSYDSSSYDSSSYDSSSYDSSSYDDSGY